MSTLKSKHSSLPENDQELYKTIGCPGEQIMSSIQGDNLKLPAIPDDIARLKIFMLYYKDKSKRSNEASNLLY